MEKKLCLNSNCGKNRGIIFSLDAVIAIFIVLVIVATSHYYFTWKPITPTELQMIKVGYDVVSILDNKGIFDSLDRSYIENELRKVLPNNYEMRLFINTTTKNIIIETSKTTPKNKLIVCGERTFVTNNDFGKIKFWMWLK